jgi:hypothetical protein
MITTLKKLSALALATAALSAATFATSSIASANPAHGSNPPGQVISCHPGSGCTLTPSQPPFDRDHDRDHDDYRDHDRDHDRDHWRWSHYEHRGWNFPVTAVSGYAPESCVYEYKFRTIYVPGVGLERTLVKVCEAY